MRNEATNESARTVIHPQNVTSPNVTDSNTGGEGDQRLFEKKSFFKKPKK
jgi:hypothetical protein